jgi:hypothetical protein
MMLRGSCHCGAARFSVESETPYPYLWCYCSICRKTAGGGGQRHFCGRCASALWVWDRRWGEWIYPFASAIDTPLPAPRERQHIFLESKPAWVKVAAGKADKRFRRYPKEAIIDWHRERGLAAR